MIRIVPVSIALSVWTVCCLAFTLLLPSAAQAVCARWDMSGEWVFIQSNGYSPTFRLVQTETGIQGDAWYVKEVDSSGPIQHGHDSLVVKASVDGSLEGNSLNITAYWDNGTTGVYTGSVGPQGRIEGSTKDADNPRSMASWHSNRTAKCLTSAGGTASPLSVNPPAGGASQPSNVEARCNEYASNAVRQNAENVSLRCGFTGPRWDSTVANHKQWCLVVDDKSPVSETAARATDLDRCRQSKPEKPVKKLGKRLPGTTN